MAHESTPRSPLQIRSLGSIRCPHLHSFTFIKLHICAVILHCTNLLRRLADVLLDVSGQDVSWACRAKPGAQSVFVCALLPASRLPIARLQHHPTHCQFFLVLHCTIQYKVDSLVQGKAVQHETRQNSPRVLVIQYKADSLVQGQARQHKARQNSPCLPVKQDESNSFVQGKAVQHKARQNSPCTPVIQYKMSQTSLSKARPCNTRQGRTAPM
eukprot:1153316-Pelagomonas_calceolata.AAC.2